MHMYDKPQSESTDAPRRTDGSATIDHALIIAFRKRKKESQRQFWSRFGVTQSRGSRFESGAEIPPPVAVLLALYFSNSVSDADLARAGHLVSSGEISALLKPGQ